MDDAQTPPPTSPAARPRARGRRWARWLSATLGCLALALALALVGFSAWVWNSESGLRWSLSQVPGLSLEGWKGAIGSGQLFSARLKLVTSSGTLTLEDVDLRGMRWALHPSAGASLGLSLESATVRLAEWKSAAASASSPPPNDLRLPLHLAVKAFRINTLQVDELPPVRQLAGQLELGAHQGAQHLLTLTRLETDRAAASGTLALGTAAPLALVADLRLQSAGQTWPWQAKITGQGPLADFALHADLSGSAPAGHAPPSATLQTQIRPFATWPLGELQMRAEALDLASLSSAAPQTRLNMEATVQSAGMTSPAVVRLTARNTAPGPWDQGHLPLRSLALKATGEPGAFDHLALDELALDWGNAVAAAGRWEGSGQLSAHEATLDLNWKDWQPGPLDSRAPALKLSGPLQIKLTQLFLAEAQARFSIRAELSGQVQDGRPDRPLAALALEASGDAQSVDLREFKLTAARSEARLSGQIERSTEALWRWKLAGALKDFDARVWWPGRPGSAWREQAQRLNASLSSVAQIPEKALQDPATAWEQLKGDVHFQLLPSTWAGQSLSGSADWVAKAAAAPEGSLKIDADTLHLEGLWREKASLSLRAPRLDALRPWARLWPEAAAWVPRSGTLVIEAEASPPASPSPATAARSTSPLPSLSTPGWRWQAKLALDALEAGTLRVNHAEAQAQGGARADAPLGIQIKGDGLQLGAAKLSAISATVEGSVQSHRFQIDASSPLRPPPWLERLAMASLAPPGASPRLGSGAQRLGRPNSGAPALSGARLSVRGEGDWAEAPLPSKGTPAAASTPGNPVAGSTWHVRLAEAAVRGRAGESDAGLPWLSGSDLAAELVWNRGGALAQASLAPGELALPGTRVRWTEATWRAGSAPQGAQVSLAGELAPTLVAPLLARLQPETAWSGDLRMGGHFKLQGGAALEADLLLERLGGDLNIDEDGLLATSRQQALGLTDLRLGLVVHEGHWQFTQGLAGSYVGALGGLLSVQAPASAWWPERGSPLEGSMSLHVANLGAWATWMPAGWRLGGELSSAAQFGGAWGAPEFSGQLSGDKLSLRNALQGVDWRDGQLRLRLDGPRAHIEAFEIHGGDGSLQVKGEASLGAEPSALLQLSAQKFRLLNRLDRRLVTSGQAELKLDNKQFSLSGKLAVDEGLFDISRGDAPTLADDVSIVRPLAEKSGASSGDDVGSSESGEAVASGSAAPSKPMQLALQIDLGKQLRLKGYGLDAGLEGTLKLGNPRGALSAQGTVRTVNGNYAAYGQKLSVDRGEIYFVGPLDDPRLDIYALRPNLDVKVGVRITGTALNPRVRLASEPEMSDADKLSWLILGRAPEGLGQADTALLQRAALALLMGEDGGPADGLLSKIGLSDFNVRQANDGTVQTTVVSLGKQISRRWYVGYERGVNATAGTWQLIYRVAQRLTVRAQSGSDSALDAIWTWRWN